MIPHADIDGKRPDDRRSDVDVLLLTTPEIHPEVVPPRTAASTSSDAEVDAKLLDTHRIEVDIMGAVGRNARWSNAHDYTASTRDVLTVEDLDRDRQRASLGLDSHLRDPGETRSPLSGCDVAHRDCLDQYFQPAP